LTIPFAPYLQQTLDKLRNCYKEQKQLAAQVGAKSADIAQMLRDIEDYQPGLLSQIENPETRILTSVEGEEATRSMLTLVNDMIRLAHLEPFIHLSLAKELREELAASIEGLPLVEVKFKNPILIPDDQGDELGTMTLIDTPGRNEADAKGSSSDPLISGFLNEVHDKVLGEVDALLVVRPSHPTHFLSTEKFNIIITVTITQRSLMRDGLSLSKRWACSLRRRWPSAIDCTFLQISLILAKLMIKNWKSTLMTTLSVLRSTQE
jgi:hypothetical protein